MTSTFLNSVFLTGTAEDISFKAGKSNKEFCTFTLGVANIKKDLPQTKEKFDVVVYNTIAIDFLKIFNKKDNLYIWGEIKNVSFTDEKGTIQKSNKIIISNTGGLRTVSSAFHINKAILAGNINGLNFKMSKFEKEICLFSLATSSYYKDPATGELKQNTDWHNIVVYSEYICKMLKTYKQGDKIQLEGEAKINEWVDAESITRKSTQIVLNYRGFVQQITKKEEKSLYDEDIDNLDDSLFELDSDDKFFEDEEDKKDLNFDDEELAF